MKRHFPVTLREAACALPRAGRLVRPARNIDQTIRQPFRRLRPAPPVANERVGTALHGTSPGLPAGFYLSHNPTLRPFNQLVLQRHAPGTLPAAAELPALAMFFELRVTSLSGVTRRDRHRMRNSPEAHTVCTNNNGDFWGPNVEASPYPAMEIIRGLAPSPAILTGKTLSGLSWLSYSRPPDLPAVPGVDHRFRLLPGWKLPTPARLNERSAGTPVDRICTCFEHDGPGLEQQPGDVRIAPARNVSDRMPGLLGAHHAFRITPASLRRTGRAPLDATQLYGTISRRVVSPPP
jgi:hypothetical protein